MDTEQQPASAIQEDDDEDDRFEWLCATLEAVAEELQAKIGDPSVFASARTILASRLYAVRTSVCAAGSTCFSELDGKSYQGVVLDRKGKLLDVQDLLVSEQPIEIQRERMSRQLRVQPRTETQKLCA